MAFSPSFNLLTLTACLAVLAFFGTTARAQEPASLIVTTTADVADAFDNRTSLREAITYANNKAGFDTITFNIDNAQFGPPPHVIHVATALPSISTPMMIDGLSEPDIVGGISPIGNATNDDLAIQINASASILYGLLVNSSGAGTTIRGLSITGFGSAGAIQIQAVATISSNYIGVAADGTTPGGNSDGIVAFSVGPGSLIGGPNPGDGNVIAHSTSPGVSIIPSSGVTVQGNTIRNNGGAGIHCTNAGTRNRFQENLIYGNGSLGINLGASGVTANDADDSDGGPNNLQNFPVLTAAATGSTTFVAGSLTTQAGTYTLEFYSSPANDAQGQKFLGRLSNFTVATTGVAQTFSVSNLAAATVGHYVTATAISESDTATSDIGDTSEFSAGLIIAAMEPPSLVVTTVSDASTSTDGQTSLREAITYANSFSDGLPHTVTFSNSGANGAVNFHDGTARTITLGGTELVISGYVTIDGPGAARLSISGNNASRVLYVTATGVATLNDLTITGGNGVGAANLNFGGGISSRGTLSVIRCVVTANTALFAGGGIFSGDNGSLAATLYVIDSVLHSNSAGAGGGADSRVGQFCLINSTVANNTGSTGGLSANAGQVTAVNSTITGNVGSTSARIGGVSDCFFTARNTILAGNSGTRPDFAFAQFISLGYNMIGDTTGASLNPPATGDLRNLAGNLGALQNNGGPTFTCALLPGSPAIHAGSPTVSEIQSVTVRGSSGTFTLTVGGQTTAPLAYNSSAATVQSALEGLSTVGAGNVNVRLGGGTYTLQYHVGALANATVPDISAAGSGGATAQAQTILQGGSNTMADQRGKTRSGAADMGAVETQGFTLTASGGTPQVTTPGTAFSQPLVATITPNDPNDPVDGGKVTFTSQGTTASATLATSPATISGGQASVTATANGTTGSYTVSATTTGAAAVATYSLTNLETASLTVTTTSDTSTNTDGQTSLREALAYAASLTGPQMVTFSNSTANGAVNFHDGTARTITLNGTELAITSDITLTGPGADVLAVSGGQQSRVLNFEAGVAATLRGVKVTNGKNTARDNGYGGGIFNAGTLRVENCVIRGNTTAPTTVSGSAASYGGGIYSSGPLTLIQCTVAGNESTHPQGIELNNYNVQGAGIWCGADLEVTGTTISDNEAALSGGTGDINGGGIFFVGIRMTVVNSTISGNSVLVGSGVSNGHGGGVFVRDGMADFIQCTMAGNSARSGGGVAFGTAILQQNVRFRSCVIAGNLSTSTPGTSRYSPEVYPYHTSLGYNLVGDPVNSFGWIATDILDPAGGAKLGPLQDNGGPTPTHALLAGSPAIDAGDPAFDPNAFTPPLTTDQRGVGFARVIKGLSASPAPIIDIGAFESPITQYPEIVLYAGSHSLAPELSDGQVMAVNFGSTAPNVASTRNFLVRNTGDAPLDITTITVPSGYLTNGAATTISPGAFYVFQVALESSVSNTYVGSIVISSSDLDESSFDFPVTGTVVAPGSDPVVNVGENIAVQGATGSAVLGGPVGSTLYQFVGSPALNPGGVLASAVQIRHADASLHTGMMVGQPMVLIATDTQAAPSLPGVNHFNFGPPVINESGHVAFTGEVRGAGITTNVNSRCLFSNASDGALKLVARTGTSVGLSSNLKTIGNFSIGGDLIIFLGTLMDKSIVLFGWDANTGLRPLMRNGQNLDANGVTKTVKSFGILETGNASSGHGREFSVAPTGESLVTISVVFTDNTQAVVVGSFDGTSDTGFGVTYATSQQLADSYAAPGVIPQARWSTFRSPGFDNTGTYYGFISQMVTNTLAGVTSTNNVGVFVDTAPGVLTLQLRENAAAPGTTAGVVFSDFSDLVLGGGDYEFLVKGEIRGSGVVTNVNNKGLWAQHATNGLVLVAREGSEAPGVAGSTFFRLTQLALPGTAQPMFQASMKTGAGGVTTANDTGLWVINETGEVKLAVREGDVINIGGTNRTVTAITALLNGTTTGGALGRRVFLADGQLTLLLTFSGGVQAHARVVVP